MSLSQQNQTKRKRKREKEDLYLLFNRSSELPEKNLTADGQQNETIFKRN